MGIVGAQSHCDSRFKIHFYRISIKRHSSFNLEKFTLHVVGFLLGIFSAESIVVQISIVMLLFSDQISGRGKSFQGGKLPQWGAPLWKKSSAGFLA